MATGMAEWYEDNDFWEHLLPLLEDDSRSGNPGQQVDQILQLLQLNRRADVLDLACGPGRHSIELARRGRSVTGLDRTSHYIEIARERAAAAELEVDFVEEDMRSFCRPEAYDAAICMLSSFGYFADPDDDRRVLANLYSSLRSGGRVVLDMAGKEVLARVYQDRDWYEFNDGSLLLEERSVTASWDEMVGRWIFIDEAGKVEYPSRLRLYSAAEMARELRAAGFTAIELYGGLDGSPYNNEAKRLVAIGRKQTS
jgi:SAM-dependent methyltransferase